MTGERLVVAHRDATPLHDACAFLPEWPGLPIGDTHDPVREIIPSVKSIPSLLRHLARLPLACVLQAVVVKAFGSPSAQEQFNLLRRPDYAYGLYRAGRQAKAIGTPAVTACEFGVAAGAGLRNLVALAAVIGKDLGITFRIVGFDGGIGLPAVADYRDHPELFRPGDFANADLDALARSLGGKAEIIVGDVADTVPTFRATLDRRCPLGFVAFDLDTYGSTRAALQILAGEHPDAYVPGVSCYFDDIMFYLSNEWCGELLAIREFNDTNAIRKIGQDRSLPGFRPLPQSTWYQKFYVCHVLDHPVRQKGLARDRMALPEWYAFYDETWGFH